MKKTLITSLAITAGLAAYGATTPQTADGNDGFGVFTSSGGFDTNNDSAVNAGTFTGASDIGNPAWGFFANSGDLSEALYDFDGGALTIGQTVSVQMDNGNIQNGGSVGINFQNITSGVDRASVFFEGGTSGYQVFDNSGTSSSGVSFTNTGLTIDLTLTGVDSYDLTITPIGGTATNLSGTLSGTAGSDVDRVRFFNFNAGSGSTNDAFFNNLTVVPEPGSFALFAGLLGLTSVALRRRNRA